jgi:hypothetical protein
MLFFIVVGSLFISMLLKFFIYFFFADDFDPDHPYASAVNMVMVMVVTTIIPFAFGCAVGLYAIS